MYEQYKEILKPKPILNLKWYCGDDLYSDGDVEDKIIELIAENEPENYISAIYDNFSWATYYHLTHIRKNLLNWYKFMPNSNVLEIGCGMGALTSVLCDKCRDVTSVEMSERRATATLFRCRKYENLEIIVGNLNDIEFSKKFDYITLIGVLEYQGTYTNSNNPYVDFLRKVKSLLKPDGKLLIAIENQFGLKYWCGTREEHTGVPFDGLNDYSLTNRKVRTFSRNKLKEMIVESGFCDTFFYYPLPDYKLPTIVYSEEYLPKNENMHNMREYYQHTDTLVADESELYKEVIENNAFEFMANSFLVECSSCKKSEEDRCVFASLSTFRNDEYRIGTRINADGSVEKFSLSGIGNGHLEEIIKNNVELQMRGINVVQLGLSEGILRCEYQKSKILEDVIREAIESGEKEQARKLIKMAYDDIIISSDFADSRENIMFELGIDSFDENDTQKYGPILKKGYIDMIFRNTFITEGKLYWFDQEWVIENVPAQFIIFRAISELYKSFPGINDIYSLSEMIKDFSLDNVWTNYQRLNTIFTVSVVDQKDIRAVLKYRPNNLKKSIVNNLNKMLRG